MQVGPCPDPTNSGKEAKVKVGFHRQGDIMNNEEFQLPNLLKKEREDLLDKLPQIRKDIKSEQSFETDKFILDKAKTMVHERLPKLDPDNVSLVMRCLYQNTPDKEFIIGFHPDCPNNKKDIVIACGFNGGGFQMGPTVARLCIKLLLSDFLPTDEIVKMLETEETPLMENENFRRIKLDELLHQMETRFHPSRFNISEFLRKS